jgi:hypothetical protein
MLQVPFREHYSDRLLAASGDHYEGTYLAAPNGGLSDHLYDVEVKATDAHGAVSAGKQASFTVKAPASPPPRPW